MTIQEMHIRFKSALDKVDAAGNRDLLPEHIDMLLNAGQYLFIKHVIAPVKNKFLYGFEFNQRAIDSIRTLVSEDVSLTSVYSDSDVTVYSLPEDYIMHVKSDVLVHDEVCGSDVRCMVKIRQHADNFYNSVFDKSNVLWRFVNGTFSGRYGSVTGNLLIVYYSPVSAALMTYIRRPVYMTIAGDLGGYRLPDGTLLTTNQDCELPDFVHDEVVSYAVLIAKGDIEMPTIQYTMVEQQQMEN